MNALMNWRDGLIVTSLPFAAGFAVLGPQGLTWFVSILALMMLFVWPQRSSVTRPADVIKDQFAILAVLMLFCVWTVVRSVTAPNPSVAIWSAGSFFFCVGSVVAAMILSTRMGNNGRWIWSFFPVVHACLSLVTALILLNWVSLAVVGNPRLTMSWHFNRVALLIALMWPLSLFAIRAFASTLSLRLVLALPLYALTCWIVFKSESQSAQLALLVMSVVQAAALINLNITTRLVGIGSSALVMLTPVAFGPIYRWYQSTAFWELNPGTFAVRTQLWRSTLDYISQSPWIGHGVEYVRDVGNVNPETGALMLHNHPHSFLFQVWVDTGLVGAALLAILILLIANLIRIIGRESGLLFTALMPGILTIWAVSHGMWQSWFVGMAGVVCVFGAIMHQRSLVDARSMP